MTKQQIKYFCKNCGHSASKWLGKCPSCEEWNTFSEEIVKKDDHSKVLWGRTKKASIEATKMQDIEKGNEERILLPDNELNRVLGGGLVSGSIILIGGEPGIGKSTLLLQLALQINKEVLYISGEESESQIKMRAERIGIKNENCYVMCETSLSNLLSYLGKHQPEVLIVDSVQTLSSENIDSPPGSISQIKESTAELLRFAKETGVPVFLIGHINKDGNIAGPKVLEHMVDTVLQFEGDRHYNYRILRTLKNRFGSASEIGIYEMRGDGLREIDNPSEILISEREELLSGITISCAVEGIRPILLETQALVSSAVYGTPQRTSNGFDLRRLSMLLAVLEKRCGFQLVAKDVFINIAGGMKLEDPGLDLGIVCAILSSYQNMTISSEIAFSAEIGLSGEVRAVSRIEQRISEAQKLGFKEMMVSKYNKGIDTKNAKIKIIQIGKIEEAFEYLFG
ncbi:MAG: DNA repair protein RadA [Bacteroidota bacterium]|nr:DNA repair protein RadA [Bacteroidota bacterium]